MQWKLDITNLYNSPRYNDDLPYPSHDVIHLEKSLDITQP